MKVAVSANCRHIYQLTVSPPARSLSSADDLPVRARQRRSSYAYLPQILRYPHASSLNTPSTARISH